MDVEDIGSAGQEVESVFLVPPILDILLSRCRSKYVSLDRGVSGHAKIKRKTMQRRKREYFAAKAA
jgi:hypothetical protein